ncbi:MAG: hypothetical protein R3F60_08970 [bacterium]
MVVVPVFRSSFLLTATSHTPFTDSLAAPSGRHARPDIDHAREDGKFLPVDF